MSYDEFFQVPEWKNNWDLESAKKACQVYLEESPAYEPCSTLTKVNTESILTSCVLNIRVISIHIFYYQVYLALYFICFYM